jgi:hypothetical protein
MTDEIRLLKEQRRKLDLKIKDLQDKEAQAMCPLKVGQFVKKKGSRHKWEVCRITYNPICNWAADLTIGGKGSVKKPASWFSDVTVYND